MNYQWAVIGCGQIAREMASDLARKGHAFYGIYNRTLEKAKNFAEEFGVERVYESLEEILADDQVQILYLASPHNSHYPIIRQALLAGKHVLAEKAITLNASQLEEVSLLAQERDLILAEAMTIYHMPLFKELRDRVASGEFGPLQMIQINFGSYKDYQMTNRFFNPKLAGGALLDIGVYALSCANWFLTSPVETILSQKVKAASGVDERSMILLNNDQDEQVSISLSLHAKQAKRASIICQEAYIEIYDFPRADQADIYYGASGLKESLHLGSSQEALINEVEAMEEAVANQGNMYLDKSRQVMQIMTKLRQDWQVLYPEEGADHAS